MRSLEQTSEEDENEVIIRNLKNLVTGKSKAKEVSHDDQNGEEASIDDRLSLPLSFRQNDLELASLSLKSIQANQQACKKKANRN